MNLPIKKIILSVIIGVWITSSLCLADESAESDVFPLYACIEPNVSFWIKIFSQYSSGQGIIHDKQDVSRIYAVIDLVNADRMGSKKINRQRIKRSKETYRAILKKLIRGESLTRSLEWRVAKMFGPKATSKDFRAAMHNIRFQLGLKDKFRKGLIRSGAYIEIIKQIFRQAGLPEDLAYLPHVESSFNPNAYSKSDAVGTWQFTRSTGKAFLKVGYAVDERWDPILSSQAAAKYLQENYQKLQSWPMAITAYNHGTYGMLRAKRALGSYEAVFKSYRRRLFGFASRNFYSEFLAAREVARRYHQYFGELKLDRPDSHREVVLGGYVSLPELARHLKINLAELGILNPALREPVIQGEKYVPRGYRLRLPHRRDDAKKVLISQLPKTLYRLKQKRSQFHTVRRGETAGKIASRHGVKLNALIAANNLDSRATIYIKQKLKIPSPAKQAVQIAKN